MGGGSGKTGKIGAAMQEHEGIVSEGAADSLGFLLRNLIKDAKMMKVFEVFGFWKEYCMVWEIKRVPDIVLDIGKVRTFVFVPENMNDEVIDPFPCGTNVHMFPYVHCGIGDFTLESGCGGGAKSDMSQGHVASRGRVEEYGVKEGGKLDVRMRLLEILYPMMLKDTISRHNICEVHRHGNNNNNNNKENKQNNNNNIKEDHTKLLSCSNSSARKLCKAIKVTPKAQAESGTDILGVQHQVPFQ
ncbi:hypothetical protein EDD22DRAFT_847643 [Suillus occidentalis]|nr:hypothetical protein EDD22DRAFT_847643 [Suillus occidentalis]